MAAQGHHCADPSPAPQAHEPLCSPLQNQHQARGAVPAPFARRLNPPRGRRPNHVPRPRWHRVCPHQRRHFWPRNGAFLAAGAAAFDLALFCSSLQVSAVFGHRPVSPAIFQPCCSRGGSGQPGGSSAEITLAPSSGERRQPPGRRGAPGPPRRVLLANPLAGTQPTLIAISILVAALCRQNRFCLYNESLLNINLHRVKWRQ